jgi:hypothetical protein
MPSPRIASLVSLACTAALAAQSGWSAPVLETTLNSTASDTGPNLSFDGTTLHFASFRSGNWEIWSATRTGPGAPWSTPVQEAALADAAVDDQPFLTADGLELWFGSSRAGGTGSTDILRAVRPSPTSPWGTPAFVTELNSTAFDSSVSLTADGLECYFLSTGHGAPAAPNNALFRATRAATALPFDPPVLVSELANANTHRDCEVGPDGLTLVYTEYVAPRLQVLFTQRLDRSAAWDAPVVLAEFSAIGTLQGVFGFSRAALGDEAILAAGFAAAAGSQELMSTSFTGVTRLGQASAQSTLTIGYSDPQNPVAPFAIGAALGNTGFALGALTVPLDPDWLLLGTLGQSIPGYTTGWSGALDGLGKATGTLTNPNPALVGFTIWVGGLTWGNAPFGVQTVMNSVPVLLQ